MPHLTFQTNLRCGACVDKIRPVLDAESRIERWSADVANPEKLLTVEGAEITREFVDGLLRSKGYQVTGEISQAAAVATGSVNPGLAEPRAITYFPLLLILTYLLLITLGVECAAGAWDTMRWMRHFMAGFFLVFSFFKLLNLSAFADAYSSYDLIAARWRGWGVIYPFVELLLGLAFLTNVAPMATNVVTLAVMGVSTLGVLQSVLARRRIRCACLGAVFHLPMSAVTLVEDLLMVGMSAAMLMLA
jgi:hypothetical protein